MRGCPGCGAAPTPGAAARRGRSRPAPRRWNSLRRRSGLRSGWPGCCPMFIRIRHLPLLLARGSPRDQDPVRSNATGPKPCRRCSAGTSPPISGCLAPSRSQEHSTQKPGQCPRARTAGSGCPKPAGQSSSAAYRTAAIVRHVCGGGHAGGGPMATAGHRRPGRCAACCCGLPVLAGRRPGAGYLDAGGLIASAPVAGRDGPGRGWHG